MTNSDTAESPNPQLLTNALLKLRMHEGLTPPHLARDSRNAEALITLPAVEELARERTTTAFDAAPEVVRLGLLLVPDVTHRMVADAVLALGLYSDDYLKYGVPQSVVDGLSSESVGRRRATLLKYWLRLHRALEVPAGTSPSDKTLRDSIELSVFQELAARLAGARTLEELRNPQPVAGAAGKVLVVGAAVMDAVFSGKRIPQLETSERAYDFSLSPGGKGLTQAIAAARLGLEVSLIATVADDQFGEQIIATLEAANVGTSLLKRVPGGRTPFIGIFEQDQGNSAAMVWRNEPEMSLDVRDLIDRTEHFLACNAILLTFEIPRATLQQGLHLAHTDTKSRPVVIVTPGQPYTAEGIQPSALRLIDVMVAHAWELRQYEPVNLRRFDPNVVGRHLLSLGVDTLCLLGNSGGLIYSETPLGDVRLPNVSVLSKETALARDVFCAALAAALIDHDRKLSEDVVKWATAAMACAAESFGTDHPLPQRADVEQRVLTMPPLTP